MSDHYPATAQELASIRDSVTSARVRLSWVGTRLKWAKKFQVAQYAPRRLTFEQQREAFFCYLRYNLENLSDDWEGFQCATGEERENYTFLTLLNKAWVKMVLTQAAEKEDVGFFIYMGKLLDSADKAEKAKYKETKSPKKCKTVALQTFLFEHYAEERDDLPALCYFSTDVVANIYSALTGEDDAGDAIKKQYKRLKLLPFRGKKIRATLLKDGRWRFDKPDGTVSVWSPKLPGAPP